MGPRALRKFTQREARFANQTSNSGGIFGAAGCNSYRNPRYQVDHLNYSRYRNFSHYRKFPIPNSMRFKFTELASPTKRTFGPPTQSRATDASQAESQSNIGRMDMCPSYKCALRSNPPSNTRINPPHPP